MPPERARVIARSAVISADQNYRYRLTRTLDKGVGSVVFIMLNPSTADADIDDPTIRRCLGFAEAWGYAEVVVVNLFSWRATQPSALQLVSDPVGEETAHHLAAAAAEAGLIVCAWGAHGGFMARSLHVRQLLAQAGHAVHHLGLTQAGEPRHPLYLKGDTVPQPWLFAGNHENIDLPLPA